MTSFWTLFKEFFKQKSKPAYLIFVIQAAAALVTVIMTMFSSEMQNPQMFGAKINVAVAWFLAFVVTFLGYSFFADFAYLIITSRSNEKINRSQTWRLVPMSNGKMYICNTLSSFVSLVYLAVMQAIVGLVGGLVMYASSSDLREELAKAIHHEATVDHWQDVNFGDLFLLLLFMVLLGLLWYVVISFLHFTTRAVIDFLPFISNKFVIFVIRVVVLVAVVYVLSKGMGFISEIGNNPLFLTDDSFASDIGVGVITLLIMNVVLGALNYILIDKFVEAKQNN
ncbi:hypothetical protein GCM10022297_13500 [Lactobacillus hamsteri]|uniref:Uncharacterized protein n=1 Tax=Lactobacillus hamsteri DSM 5661 = JCM 6256 TaxID=1423754 RepID=A0A0R1Y7E6_9LACO|nr:hypothetical protein [Lactobacillus hamsteri]KRM38045.1 hypothetical protein FC39_GL001437 [Lactobacillus hamsteri DSM 5661 = JCM 6256]